MTIEETISKYNLLDHKYYRLNTLYMIFVELGIVSMKREHFTSDWMRRKIKKGVVVLPAKRPEEHWKLTGEMIKDIVKAFAPGGSGQYTYENDTTIS